MLRKEVKFRHGKYSYRVQQVGEKKIMVKPWMDTGDNAYATIDVDVDLTTSLGIDLHFFTFCPPLYCKENKPHSKSLQSLESALLHSVKLIERYIGR